MIRTSLQQFVAILVVSTLQVACAPANGSPSPDTVQPMAGASAQSLNRSAVDKITAGWATRPRLGANTMIAKYGLPQEATAQQLIWRNAGPFKRIAVMNLETPHDFPLPHVDFMEHTIEYNVPQSKVGDLIAFDASSTINRTVGELSARCDLEGHNVLTLNLDHDIVLGKMTVAAARKAFGDIVNEDVAGKHPPYVEALQFKPAAEGSAAFSDMPVIAGSPERAADTTSDAKAKLSANGAKSMDAEILATVAAIDLNEVVAAMQAGTKKIDPAIQAYAKMLHEAHGMNMGKGLKLGQMIGVTPVNTAAVEALQVKGAGELADIVPLDNAEFARAYLAAMIKGHAEVLSMIDAKLMPVASNEAVKKHLTETRSAVAAHLQQAKSLQGAQSK